MAEKAKETAIIIDQKELLPGIFDMWLRTEKIAKEAKAGQFVSVYCHDGSRILPRPISICEIDKEDGAIRLVYRVAGKGNAHRHALAAGRAAWQRISEERKKSVFDRRRNRNSADVGARKRIKL